MQNCHVLLVKFLSATNNNGARVKIISERFEQSKTIPFNYEHGNTLDTAKEWISHQGFDILGVGEGKDCYYVITNTFKGLK